MENLEELKEKSINFWIRNVLRVMAWVILLFYMIFRILLPIKDKEKVLLDQNDGWVIFSCMCLLFAIESVRALIKARLRKFTGNNDIENVGLNKIASDDGKDGAVTPKKGF